MIRRFLKKVIAAALSMELAISLLTVDPSVNVSDTGSVFGVRQVRAGYIKDMDNHHYLDICVSVKRYDPGVICFF